MSQASPSGTSLTGALLAAGLISVWALSIGLSVFLFPLSGAGLWGALPLAAFHMWLFVGLFIIAHDAMHASLIPGQARLNRGLGSLCLFLYAGFDFASALPKHMQHHAAPGSNRDPDGHSSNRFWPWYGSFLRTYFGWRNVAFVGSVATAFLLLGAKPANLLLFWAMPAILSSLQLFTFGTFLPHRQAETGFPDAHHARSNDWPVWLSLLTCFHFGYHHEHHLHPGAPWWRLPQMRSKERALP